MKLKASGSFPSFPQIYPLAEGIHRPFWSVMIPTYRPERRFLEQTLRSVLDQDPGREQMQIEVVDDCSPDMNVGKLVAEIAGDRVGFHASPRNQGLAGNWNLCLDRSRGRWVHLLHQDDLVLPGFYCEFRRPLEQRPEIGFAFCRHGYIDETGRRFLVEKVERTEPGILEDAAAKIFSRLRIQTPCIVVRRAVYEAEGGYARDLCYTLDWEMWMRLSLKYPLWYEPGILAHYRFHRGAETRRLAKAGQKYTDVIACLDLAAHRAVSADLQASCRIAHRTYGQAAVVEAVRAAANGEWRAAWVLLKQAGALAGATRTVCYLLIEPALAPWRRSKYAYRVRTAWRCRHGSAAVCGGSIREAGRRNSSAA